MHQHENNTKFQTEMDEMTLRIELENELKRKKQCAYQAYECTQLILDGYKFCSKHILQDKNAPFKQCSFIYSSSGKRCNLPAPRSDKKDYGYCSEHALKAASARNRQNAKHPLPCTAEVLLHSLSHYVKKPRIRCTSSSTQHSDDGDRIISDSEQKSARFLDPFVDFDASSLYNDKCNNVLDVCSESESDIEVSTFSSVWQDAHADSSDNESIDSDNEDVLKHANVYTAEEITLMAKDKLIRLQSLYIEQYRHLQYLLTKKRRKYLHSLKREKETCCNIYNQVRDNPKEQRLYKKLKALNNYQKCHGADAILSKRLRDLRVKASDGTAKAQMYSKCIFAEGGVKCGERSLPLTKYCQKHIMEDQNQILFRFCGRVTADVSCSTPLPAIFDDSTCPLHLQIPALRSYGQVRKDSESDADEITDTHMNFQQPSTEIPDNIKTELINYDIHTEIPKMESVPSMLFEESTRNSPEITSTAHSMFNVDFSNETEHKENANLIEEIVKSEDNPIEVSASNMEVSTVFVENEISMDVEVKEENIDFNVESVEVTRDDIDVTGNVDLEEETVIEEEVHGVVEEDHSVIEEDHSVVEEVHSIVEEVHSVVEEDHSVVEEDHSVYEEDHSVYEEDHSVVEEDYSVNEEDHSVVEEESNSFQTCSKETTNEFHPTRTQEHNSDLGDTAVDALLKAAEMIDDQDNKINTKVPVIQEVADLDGSQLQVDIQQIDNRSEMEATIENN